MDKENLYNIDIWNKFIEDVKNEFIENIVIVCIDLNVVLEKLYFLINIVDLLKCLVELVVNKYLKLVK